MTFRKLTLLSFVLVSFCSESIAQNTQPNVVSGTVIFFVILLILAVLILLADNFLEVSNLKTKGSSASADSSILAGLGHWNAPKLPDFVQGKPLHILKKGFDIKLEGSPSTAISDKPVTRFALQPPNYRGIAPIPKMEVIEGQEVKAGDPIFFDKAHPEIKYVAPVSGEILSIQRGDKRAITEVIILADKEQKYRSIPELDYQNASREELVDFLMEYGGWTLMIQRPFDIVPQKEVVPENIFISTFDTAPLAPDNNAIIAGQENAFYAGLSVLGRLTSGKVYLGLSAKELPSAIFTNAPAEKVYFHGAHPAGNVGVQIHHIDSIGKGQRVWTLTVQNVLILGRLFTERRYNTSRIIALSGQFFTHPRLVKTYSGAHIGELIQGETEQGHYRLISGDVLSGQKKSADNFINFNDDQLTAIEEGDYYEMFGWLLPGKPRPSVSRTYPNFLFGDATYSGDTNTHGEKRAFVVTGQYEDLLPMDIYPQHLFKAIITNDFERMEGLGIYELSEEDVALCEFSCTSKQPLQKILRTGLNSVQEQG